MQKLLVIAFLALIAGAAFAGPASTAVVEKGDLEISFEVKGAVGPGRVAEARLAPLAYRGRFEILTVLEAGSRVSEGEVVVRFDDKELREALDNARLELESARHGMDALRERHSMAARDSELGLESRMRDLEMAEQALERYHNHTLPNANRRASNDEEGYQVSVDNAKEELAQLLKMYEEDELVDDTEEIVLKRARWDLLSRERRFGYWRISRALQLEYDNPARIYALRRSLLLKRVSLDKARREEKIAAVSRRAEMERAERAMEKRIKGLEELEADLASMVVRAPRNGILLHGEAGTGVGMSYSPGDQVNAKSVVATIADPDDLRVHMRLPAKETLRLRTGQAVFLKAAAVGAGEINGHVEHRDILPRDGAIVTRVKPDVNIPAGLLGIPVSGRLVIDVVESAMLLPVAAVERDGDSAWVSSVGENGKAVRVAITVGADDGQNIVITGGLAEADKVYLPEEKK